MKSSFLDINPRLLIALVVLGVGGAVAMLGADQASSQFLRGMDLPGDLEKAINLAEVFGHSSGAAAILISVLIVARERRSAVWGAILITLTAGIAANLSKLAVVRIRPHSLGVLEVVTSDSRDEAFDTNSDIERARPSFWDSRQRSFPSGHAATAWGLAIGLALVFPRGAVLFATFAILASLQRVFCGAHFPSDVFAGAAVACFCALILLAIPGVRVLFQVDQERFQAEQNAKGLSG